MDQIYLFHSPNTSRFCGGVFSSKVLAEVWILENQLSGVLTVYPIDVGVYEWAIAEGIFTPRNEKQLSPAFKAGFTSAGQEHYHYENEKLE